MNFLGKAISCDYEESSVPSDLFGSDETDANVVIRSSNNSQTLYIDGAGSSGWPIYVGITKSGGTQQKKLPTKPNDIIGGLQAYARIIEGQSLGYNHLETPLAGSIIFKVGDTVDSSELLIAVKKQNQLTVKLVLDSDGNLHVAGTLNTGKLTITDELTTPANNIPVRYVKAIYDGIEYAMPLYLIQ